MVEKGVLGGVSLGRLYPGEASARERAGRRGDRDGHRRGYRRARSGARRRCWHDHQPERAGARRAPERGEGDAPATFTGNRALMLEEPLMFEIGDTETTGVDFAERRRPAHAPRRPRARRGRSACPASPSPRRCATTPACRARITRSTSACSRSARCTMKHNPRLNEKVARLPGFADIHPLQPQDTVQGALELINELADWLIDADRHARRGDEPQGRRAWRTVRPARASARRSRRAATRAQVVLVPESAHGTNPATAAFAGYRVENIPATAAGPGRPRSARRRGSGPTSRR